MEETKITGLIAGRRSRIQRRDTAGSSLRRRCAAEWNSHIQPPLRIGRRHQRPVIQRDDRRARGQ